MNTDGAELDNVQIEVNIGLGEIFMEVCELGGVPTILIHKLKEKREPHTIVTGAECVGVPIALKFHNMDAVMTMYRMVAPITCDYHMRDLEEAIKKEQEGKYEDRASND